MAEAAWAASKVKRSTYEHLTDNVAATADAFYEMSGINRKNALMRVLEEISLNEPDRKRSSDGGG